MTSTHADPGPLHGRVALVTGANHGIGAAIAARLAADGAAVLVTYLRTPVSAEATTTPAYRDNRLRSGDDVAARIEVAGGRAEAVEADLLDASVPAMLFDRAEARFGPVDILVNNATGWLAGDSFVRGIDAVDRQTVAVTAELIDRTFGVDARAAALLLAEFSSRHLARGASWGRIVGLTSGGPDGFPGEVSYGAAKAAQVSYTLSAATELARRGVTANVVHPPITDTGWVDAAVRAFTATDPVHVHVAEPAEVAGVVAWLCTDAARMVTGNVIRMR